MKNTFKRILKTTGLFRLVNLLAPSKLNVLFYHGFFNGKEKTNNNLLAIDIFESHLRLFQKYANPITVHDLLNGRRLPPSPVMITFDDGYENNYRLAFPLIKKYKMPISIFLTTGFVDKKIFLWSDWLDHIIENSAIDEIEKNINKVMPMINILGIGRKAGISRKIKIYLKSMPVDLIFRSLSNLQEIMGVEYGWETISDQIRPLSWEQIREMSKSGLISMGSHTYSHPIMSRCSLEMQKYELFASKKRIEEEVGNPCRIFAYPNGKENDYSMETIELVKECNFEIAFNAISGYNNVSILDKYNLNRWGGGIESIDLENILSRAPLIRNYLWGKSGRKYLENNMENDARKINVK